MHAVEDAEGQADVDDGCPEGVAIEVHLHGVAEVGAGPEGGHDPQLWGQRGVRTWPGLVPVGLLGGVGAGWGSQPSGFVDSEGWVLLSGDLEHLGRGLALTKELSKCAQLNLPAPQPRAPPVITSPTLSMAHLWDWGRGEEVSIDAVRIWNKWLNQ